MPPVLNDKDFENVSSEKPPVLSDNDFKQEKQEEGKEPVNISLGPIDSATKSVAEGGFGLAKKAVKGIVHDTVTDFSELAHLPFDIYRGDSQKIWTDIGGGVGALSDIAMGITLASGIATGGLSETAIPIEMAGRVALKRGVKKLAEKAMTTKGFGATEALSSFAKAKGEGKSTEDATVSGLTSGALTMGTLGLFNKFGPSINNSFAKMMNGTKIMESVQNNFSKISEYLASAQQSKALGKTAQSIKDKVSSASKGIMHTVNTLLSKTATSIEEPAPEEFTRMVQKSFDNVAIKNDITEIGYKALNESLSKFKLPKEASEKINALLGEKSIKPQGKELQDLYKAEEDRLIKTAKGEELKKIMSDLSGTAKKNVDSRYSSDEELNLLEGTQNLVMKMKAGAETNLSDLQNLISKIPEEVQNAKITTKIKDIIKDELKKANTPESNALLDEMTRLTTESSQNSLMRSMVHALDENKANWQSATQAILSKLNNEKDKDFFYQAIGEEGQQMFKKMLSKSIFGDVARAYKNVLDSANNKYTPELVDKAQKEALSALDKYTNKISELNLFTEEERNIFHDMADMIPNVDTYAKNIGVDLLDKESTKEELGLLKESPLWKTISSKSYSELPDAFLKSSIEELQATKKILGGESSPEWQSLQVSTLAKMFDKITGLWGEKNIDNIEKTLQSVSSSVSGNKEKFSEMFGGEGESLLGDISDYAQKLKASGLKKSAKASLYIAGAAGAKATGHMFLMISQLKNAAKEIFSKEESDAIDAFAQQFSKTPEEFEKQFTESIKSTGKLPKNVVDLMKKIQEPLSYYLKYVLSKKAGESSTEEGETSDEDNQ